MKLRPYTAYALVETDAKGRKELALFDARLPVFWKRTIAESVNRDRCNGNAEIVQVTLRRRGKARRAKAE